MNKYRKWNTILGWVVFLVALVTYILTLEPTVSWWDCGEFISCSYKLLIGHPPGAPLFLMTGRVFSLFTADPEKVAMMVNLVSAMASAFTIAFLFWTITYLAKKLVIQDEDISVENMVLVIGSGLIGSLAYAFSDTFWFSAVEGEVYATSSLFTAVVFWAIFKWEEIADEKHADRWLILIAYLMGLSIGVHLLNLLAIPAIVLVYYFKRYTVTPAGISKAIILSLFIIAFMMYGIIQGVVLLSTKFELLFVNVFGLGFNSGALVYFVLLFGGVGLGIAYTIRKGRVIWNSILTAFLVILIGYSSYAMIFVRSLANPPMDMNNPENVFSLLSYLNREQYGDSPLLFGHYFTDEIKRDQNGYAVLKDTKAVYRKDTASHRYVVAGRKQELRYDERSKLLPRMYSMDPSHVNAYREWTGLKQGEKVSALNDIQFLISYQLGHMYFRYFMWNFAGKQNDVQSHGSLVNGNWISGIKFIDELRLGDQDLLPDKYRNSKSRNRYFMLPFLFGLLGLLFQLNTDVKKFWVTMFLFIFTGVAIVVYLNQTPIQPRERDYAYAGSFYAFSIWVGLGVLAIYDALKKYRHGLGMAFITVILSLVVVPGLMASQNWDDHDRSGRYTARDIARNYLNSCEENAIIFTNGDNDTYPLWYVQEVEGFRTDVRVINLMLINSEWNIRQIMTRAYTSDPVKLSLGMDEYREEVNKSFYILSDPRKLRLQTMMQGIKTKNKMFIQRTVRGDEVTVIPTNNFMLPVDTLKVIENGTVSSKYSDLVIPELNWTVPQGQMLKGNLVELDILANFDWDRPVYFVTGGNEEAMNLEKFFQLEGLAYRIVPIETSGRDFFNYGHIDTELLNEKLMEKYTWGRMEKDDVYMDYYNQRTMSVIQFRRKYIRLAEAWLAEGDTVKAEAALDRCMELAPNERVPYDYHVSGLTYTDDNNQVLKQSGIIETYYRCGAEDKANAILKEYLDIAGQDLIYYNVLSTRKKGRFASEFYQSRGIYDELIRLAEEYGQEWVIEAGDQEPGSGNR